MLDSTLLQAHSDLNKRAHIPLREVTEAEIHAERVAVATESAKLHVVTPPFTASQSVTSLSASTQSALHCAHTDEQT